MQNFKTSFRHIITQGLLFVALIIFTLQPNNFDGVMRMPILLLVDGIAAIFFISSLMRKITVTEDAITVKNFMRTSTVNINSLQYAQSLSAFARWVVILNDGKHTVIMTSLTDGLAEIVEKVTPKLPNEEKDKLVAVTKESVASKKRTYDILMFGMTLVVCYGIIRNIFGL